MKTAARKEITQSTLRRSLVTHTAASKARSSLVAAHDQRVRPAGLTDAEWTCVLIRDAEPGTPQWVVAIALACAVADAIGGATCPPATASREDDSARAREPDTHRGDDSEKP